MKKLFYLLLLPITLLAQNPTSFPYGVKITGGQSINTSPSYFTTTEENGLQTKVPASLIAKTEARQAISDANYTILGTANQIIAYTSITADRTVSLPAANTANQRIWITDESGLCSNARRIIVQPNGSDVIGGDSFAVINFPNGSGYLESDGSGKWNIISTTSIQFSAGVNTMPTITDNGDGSVTIGTGVYSLFANTNGIGRPKAYQVFGNTFSLTDQATNYIYANYNTTTAAVTILQTTVESTINNITTVPIFRIFRDGTSLHIADYDSMGLALSNKIQRSFEKTEPYRFQAGEVLLGESSTRIITIGSGTIWQGGNAITLSSVASNTHTCYQFVNTSGTWSKSVVTQYNNSQYNATGGLVTLGNTNSYAVNYIFRSVGSDTDIAFVLGTGDYTLGQAQTAPIPSNLPTFITSHMVFVGRIIVQKNINTASQIDSANTTGALFTTAGVTDHNALNNLQTAQTGVTYGHITDGSQTISGAKTFTGILQSNLHWINGAADGTTTSVNFFNNGSALGAIGSSSAVNGGSASNIGLDVQGANDFEITTNSSKRLVVKGDGNVGIGTTNPLDKLHISSNADTALRLQSTSVNGKQYTIGSNTDGSLGIFDQTTFANRFWIKADGNVGIGTDTPQAKLVVDSGELLVNTNTNNGVDKIQVNGSISATSYTGGAALTGTPTAPTATAGTNTTQIATTAFVQASVRPYKVYTALISQSGTSAPTVTVLENTLSGSIVWAFDSTGQFTGTLASAFTTNKTIAFTNNSGHISADSVDIKTIYDSVNVIRLKTYSGGTIGNSLMSNASIEIRVYN